MLLVQSTAVGSCCIVMYAVRFLSVCRSLPGMTLADILPNMGVHARHDSLTRFRGITMLSMLCIPYSILLETRGNRR